MTRRPDRDVTCCFTGHRPNKLPWGHQENDPRCIQLKFKITSAVGQAWDSGSRHFICGMAQGCDLYFMEVLLRFREQHPEITIEAALPCPQQTDRWRESDRIRHKQYCEKCDIVTTVQPFYDRRCMLRRDRYMVSRSSRIIAVFNGTPGGTMATLSYAMQDNLDCIIIDPEAL